jgi:GxxExxY protein
MLKVQSHLPPEEEAIVEDAVDCGYTVHRVLGPGFRELIYQRAYCLELHARGIKFEAEKPIMVRYKSWEIPGQKVDLIVAGIVLVEIKAVPRLRRIHRAQALSYLKTLNLKIALVINFNGETFKGNVKRVVL